MTDHKHLKRRVRARMAKTGESYTTAHRHVTAPPAGHRESSLLARLLTRSGVHAYDETTLYGLGGGIGFMYFVFEYQGMHPSLTIVAQAHPAPMIPTALSRIGVPYEIKQTGSARVAERTLRETLAEGRPAICTVGAFSLPWRPRLPYPDPLDVAVLALEEQDGTTVVHLDDPLPGTTTPTKWTIPLPDFMTAWSAPKKDRHRLITIPTTPDVTPGPNAAHEAVADTAAKLTGPVLGNAFDVNFGLSGMAKLATHLADRRTKEGWTRRFSDPEAFFTAMTRLHACLETDHTAPAAGRPSTPPSWTDSPRTPAPPKPSTPTPLPLPPPPRKTPPRPHPHPDRQAPPRPHRQAPPRPQPPTHSPQPPPHPPGPPEPPPRPSPPTRPRQGSSTRPAPCGPTSPQPPSPTRRSPDTAPTWLNSASSFASPAPRSPPPWRAPRTSTPTCSPQPPPTPTSWRPPKPVPPSWPPSPRRSPKPTTLSPKPWNSSPPASPEIPAQRPTHRGEGGRSPPRPHPDLVHSRAQ
ncbi:BtrH N-terminal domain-containing protein [Thermocatellispora tengchongensis]|uniref:BtrH N-terminal domain-containing protein n=1 Tax=Thermocatellispora tengchongensis TaxID=1073253 RepID=UPI003626878E